MKIKSVILLSLFILMIVAAIRIKTIAVKPHTANTTTPETWSSSASSTWYITGTNKDTSLVMSLASESITYRFTINDTSASGDSANIKFVILVCDNLSNGTSSGLPSLFSKFVRRDSITVSNENPAMLVYKTSATTDEPLWPYHYVEATGLAANKKLSAVSVEASVSYKQ